MRFPQTLSTLVLVGSPFAVQAQAIEIALKPMNLKPPSYEAIAFVSEGPTYGNTDGAIRGRFHRVIFVSGQLAYDYPTIRLETMTYGDEACCRKVVGAKQLAAEDVSAQGVPLPSASTNALALVQWRGPQEFEVKYGGLTCRLSRLNKPKITVSCKQ